MKFIIKKALATHDNYDKSQLNELATNILDLVLKFDYAIISQRHQFEITDSIEIHAAPAGVWPSSNYAKYLENLRFEIECHAHGEFKLLIFHKGRPLPNLLNAQPLEEMYNLDVERMHESGALEEGGILAIIHASLESIPEIAERAFWPFYFAGNYYETHEPYVRARMQASV